MSYYPGQGYHGGQQHGYPPQGGYPYVFLLSKIYPKTDSRADPRNSLTMALRLLNQATATMHHRPHNMAADTHLK